MDWISRFRKEKLENSTFDNLLPDIRLSLIWLKSKVDSEKSVKTRLTKFSVKFLDRFSRTVDHNSVFVEDKQSLINSEKKPSNQVILSFWSEK